MWYKASTRINVTILILKEITGFHSPFFADWRPTALNIALCMVLHVYLFMLSYIFTHKTLSNYTEVGGLFNSQKYCMKFLLLSWEALSILKIFILSNICRSSLSEISIIGNFWGFFFFEMSMSYGNIYMFSLLSKTNFMKFI